MVTALHHIILHKLVEQPQSGYSLAKQIGESTGQKPSFGSIYPILEKLSKEGLVTVKQQGRKKIYTLTAKGKQAAIKIKTQREQFINEIIAKHKMFAEITGCDSEPVIAVLEKLKTGERPLEPVSKNALRLRNLLFGMSQNNSLQKHSKEINKILENTIKSIERLS